MNTDTHKFGLAGALTVGVWYTVITFFLWMWPTQAWKFLASAHMMTTLDMLASYKHITLMSFVIAVTIHMVFSYIFFWFFTMLYNQL